MTAEFGSFALVLAFCLALAQVVLATLGRVRGQARLAAAAEGAAAGAFLCTAMAFAALMYAFVTSDFSVANVAQNSHTAKPLFYKITGVWGSHEGSMLLWCLALTGYGAALALTGGALPARLKSTAVAIQGALGVLFLGYTVFASNPLQRLANPPVEGNSLNPLLQDPFLAIHPPFLYSGYVGMSVVFSLALAALIERRTDAAWARWIRPWTLAAWSLLTCGIMLGSFWSYYVLGWGGWWSWDPVENASFMPWLAATALLHSATVTEKRGALAGWTAFLALMAFTFSMLGAFLVRSGVLTSVHAFAIDPRRGVLLLCILGIAAGAGFAVFAWRAPRLPPGGLFAPISRESALVVNNLFLAAATFSVLFGTLYPLIRQALSGEAVSVGPPYFDLTFVPLVAGVLIIAPIAPLMPWKRADLASPLRKLAVAAVLAVVCGGLIFALGAFRHAVEALAVMLAAWLIFGSLTEIVERARGGRAGLAAVWGRLASLPRGTWGMTLAHIGLGVFILGAALQQTGRIETSAVMGLNQKLTLGGYDLVLRNVADVDGPNYAAQRAVMDVTRQGRPICVGGPERRFYPAGGQRLSRVAICVQALSDLYLVVGEPRTGMDGQPGWLVRVIWNPFVRLIFLGPLMMALGGVLSLSDRRLRFGVPRRAAAASAAPAPAE
jgi:cytochrome c-type biogenesis protein CcmF